MFKELVRSISTILPWLVAVAFVVFYPMVISIYVFVPLMIGFMGYVLLLGIDRVRIIYILFGAIYLINLEVNLSLPLFLSIVVVILFYLTIYPKLIVFKKFRCTIPLLSVVFIDLIYVIFLLGYDFIFSESSVVLDKLLIYSFIVDILTVFLL